MKDLEYRVNSSKLSVKLAEADLKEVQVNLDNGYKKLQADIDKAKADMEIQYFKLKQDVEKKKIELQRAKDWLSVAEENLEQGFEQ